MTIFKGLNNMKDSIRFDHLRIGALFTTGPGDSMFIKLDNESGPHNIEGGNARFLKDGKIIFVPAMRLTNTPTKKNFFELADAYQWELICNRRSQLAPVYQEGVET
jgi:hypothetical protein